MLRPKAAEHDLRGALAKIGLCLGPAETQHADVALLPLVRTSLYGKRPWVQRQTAERPKPGNITRVTKERLCKPKKGTTYQIWHYSLRGPAWALEALKRVYKMMVVARRQERGTPTQHSVQIGTCTKTDRAHNTWAKHEAITHGSKNDKLCVTVGTAAIQLCVRNAPCGPATTKHEKDKMTPFKQQPHTRKIAAGSAVRLALMRKTTTCDFTC